MRILWIPHTGWHIPQRAHLFCRALAERHEVHVTDWVADFSTVRDYLSFRYLRNFTYRRYNDGKITVHGIPRISPALFFQGLRKLNTQIFSRYVAQIIRQHEIDVVVGTFVVPPPKAPRLVFDLFDDNVDYWRSYKNFPQYANEIAEVEKAYIRSSDCIAAVSSVLREKAQLQLDGKNTDIRVIPNGVDFSRFQNVEGQAVRERLSITDKTVIGFVSGLGEFCGLQRLVKAFHRIYRSDFVLLIIGDGPERQPAQKWVEENNVKGVIFTGKVPYSEVQHYFAAIDVGVIPFDKAPFTDAASPIKLFEYLAAGKCVVSTDLEEVRRLNFPNVILVKDNVESLAQGLQASIEKKSSQVELDYAYDLPCLVNEYESILAGNVRK